MNKPIQPLLSMTVLGAKGKRWSIRTYLNNLNISESVATGFAGFAELPCHLWWSTDTPWVVRTPRLRCGPHFEQVTASHSKSVVHIMDAKRYKDHQEHHRNPIEPPNPSFCSVFFLTFEHRSDIHKLKRFKKYCTDSHSHTHRVQS